MGNANGLFHLRRSIAERKNKTQIAVTLWKWYQRMMQLRSNFNAVNARDATGLFHAMHGLQHTRFRNWYHHHPGGMGGELNICDLLTCCMAQDQLLQTHTGPKLKHSRAQAADGTSGHLKHPGTLLVDAQFRVNRPFAQTKSGRGG